MREACSRQTFLYDTRTIVDWNNMCSPLPKQYATFGPHKSFLATIPFISPSLRLLIRFGPERYASPSRLSIAAHQ